MLQSPQPLSHIHICPKPKVKLGPTDSFYPAPPSLDVIATATNPRQIGLTDRDLGLTEMGLQTLCFPSYHFGPTEMSDRSHRDCNVNSLFPFRNISVSPKWANRSHRGCNVNSLFPFCNFSVSPKEQIGPTEFAWPTLWLANYQIRSHRVCVIGLTEFV